MKARIVLLLVLLAGTVSAQQVPFERILNANKEPQNWLTYGGTFFNQRYSLLNQITTENVKNLELQWVLQVRAMDGTTKFEATPLVVDGVMYTVKPPTPSYEVVALDAATGRIYLDLLLHSSRIAHLLRPQQQRSRDPGRPPLSGDASTPT